MGTFDKKDCFKKIKSMKMFLKEEHFI